MYPASVNGQVSGSAIISHGHYLDDPIPSASAPPPTPPVFSVLYAADEVLGLAQERLAQLESKLAPILGPHRPTRDGGKPDQSGDSAVAARVGGLVHGLSNVVIRIEDLIARSEV